MLLLHPIMPFITEELWQRLASNTEGRPVSIALAAYPVPNPALADPEAESQVGLMQELITAARNLRSEMGVSPKTVLDGAFHGHADGTAGVVERQAEALSKLANVRLEALQGAAPEGKAMHHSADFDLVLHLPAAETAVLRERLSKQLQSLQKARDSSKRQLSNEQFLDKAPPHVVESIREKLADYESQVARIRSTLDGLS